MALASRVMPRRHPPEGPRSYSVGGNGINPPHPGGWSSVDGWDYDKSFQRMCRAIRDREASLLDKQWGMKRGVYDFAPVEKAAMNEASGMAGGYLVPPGYGLDLLFPLSEQTIIYPQAFVVPMLERTLNCPIVDSTTVQAVGTSPFFGGVSFKWGSEQTPSEVAEPKFRNVEMTAWDLIGYANVSNDWLGDTGPEGEKRLLELFGKAAAWYAEYAFFQGAGAGSQMPLGVANANTPAVLQVTRGGGGTIAVADITGMTKKLLPASWGRAIWCCSPSALDKIQQITQYFINVELGRITEGSMRAAGMLSTLPLFVTEKLPAVGTPGDLVLFDPFLYVIGVRQEVIIDVSPHVLFSTNQSQFRVWLRIDGKPAMPGSVTLQDGSSTASGFIQLK